jgi:hypothetical protein
MQRFVKHDHHRLGKLKTPKRLIKEVQHKKHCANKCKHCDEIISHNNIDNDEQHGAGVLCESEQCHDEWDYLQRSIGLCEEEAFFEFDS